MTTKHCTDDPSLIPMTPATSPSGLIQDLSRSGILIAVNKKKPSFFQTLDYICDMNVVPANSTQMAFLKSSHGLRADADTLGTFVIKYTLDIWKIIAFSASGLALLLLIVVIGQMSRR